MAHSSHHLYAHVVFATARRFPLLIEEAEIACHQVLRDALVEQDVFVLELDGLSDHIHILMKYRSSANVSDIVKHIKGKSAFLMNRNAELTTHLKWCRGYFVASVSPGDVPRISHYIRDQKKTAQAEYEAWVARHFGPPSVHF
jgi:putative transposase